MILPSTQIANMYFLNMFQILIMADSLIDSFQELGNKVRIYVTAQMHVSL